MTSRIRQLLDKYYPSRTPKVLLLGLDDGGKTTLLYLLKLGEIVPTIPSVGFNVETVHVEGTSGSTSLKKKTYEFWDVGTGCASPHHAIAMLRWYIPDSKALIWVVDSTAKDRMAESVELLEMVFAVSDGEQEEGGPSAAPRIPILILANKSDLPGAASATDIMKTFAKVTAGRIAHVCETSLKRETTGLPEAFEWLNIAIEISSAIERGVPPPPTPSHAKSITTNPREPSVLAERLRGWLERTEEDTPPGEFIAKFDSCDLPSWDHYTHIRIAYLLLNAFGRRKGKDMIFEGLEKYIKTNPHTKSRAFHLTMTYFWIQLVHFAIRNMPPDLAPQLAVSPAALDLASPVAAAATYPSSTDFFRFLLVNPHLADGSLWMEFYSKGVMMSPEAKEGMVLPDRKPLPSVVIRDAITTFGKKGTA